jgi:competence ComEA-like helix-hairpin-helix protein
MNLQPSNRRQDLPVRLGTHGYRLDGDHAVLNAELHVPPYFSGSSFGLELWACPAPHQGGAPEGVKIAEVSLDLPTPIGPHVQHVEARAAVTPPAGSGDHSMVLVLVGGNGDARRIHDFANYGRLQHFESPHLDGSVAYAIDGDEVVLSANLSNPRPEGNSSGTLCLELWASAEPYAGGIPQGHRLAGADVGSIWGGYELPNVARRVAFTAPPPGCWHVALLLREWTLAGYAPRDYRNFDATYVQAAIGGAAAAAPVSPAVTPARSVEKLRLLKPAEDGNAVEASVAPVAAAPVAPAPVAAAPVAAAPVAPAPVAAAPVAAAPVAPAPVTAAATAASASTTGKVSVHGATVEELAKLPGLSVKIAKEIVKNRPFASIEALVDVRGIGEKTLRRIKGLLTL